MIYNIGNVYLHFVHCMLLVCRIEHIIHTHYGQYQNQNHKTWQIKMSTSTFIGERITVALIIGKHADVRDETVSMTTFVLCKVLRHRHYISSAILAFSKAISYSLSFMFHNQCIYMFLSFSILILHVAGGPG